MGDLTVHATKDKIIRLSFGKKVVPVRMICPKGEQLLPDAFVPIGGRTRQPLEPIGWRGHRHVDGSQVPCGPV